MGMDNKDKTQTSVARWFEELDRLNSEPFLFDRAQPAITMQDVFDENCSDDRQSIKQCER
jgi:hypothetical protein